MVSETKEPSLLDGFKAFLMRGNVIDLAVAVVIGAAFTKIVNSVVEGVINPLVGAIGTQDLNHYSSCLSGPCRYDQGTGTVREGIPIMWGNVLSSALSFLITAAVVYFLMVLPMAKYLARQAARKAEKEGVAEVMEISELEVLKEIRDELVAQRSTTAGTAPREDGPGTTGPQPPQG